MNPFWTNLLIDVLLVIYVIDCAFMGLVIMMQRSKQEGLGAAFGGGFTDSIWGAQTSSVLVKATVWAAAIFFLLSITLARLYSNSAEMTKQGSPVLQELTQPVAPATPAPTNAAPVPTTSALPAAPAAAPVKPASASTSIPAPKPASPTPAK
jgi:preprotein translocase subunit SecG